MSLLIWAIILLIAGAIVYFVIPKNGKGIKLGGKKEGGSSESSA